MVTKTKKKKLDVKKSKPPKKIAAKKTDGRKKNGRKTGSKNKKTAKAHLSLLEYARQNGGQSPVEYLIDIFQGKKDTKEHTYSLPEKTDAAKAAAPYMHSKLKTTEIKGDLIPAVLIIEGA